MGKKRSKTAKQKQNRVAKSSVSKKFGVSVKKGGGREKKQSAASAMVLETGRTGQNTKPNDWKRSKRDRSKGGHKTGLSKSERKKKNVDTSERDEFDRQMKSLHERNQQELSRRNTLKSGNRSQLCFAKPTFVVDDKDKSTERLLHEATARIQGMDGIGNKQAIGAANRLRVLATAQKTAATSTTMDAWSTEKPSMLESNNPYAVLDDNDSDDGSQTTKTSNLANPFNFAAPAFTVPTTSASSLQTVRAMMDSIDPDL